MRGGDGALIHVLLRGAKVHGMGPCHSCFAPHEHVLVLAFVISSLTYVRTSVAILAQVLAQVLLGEVFP